ncbi:dual specificity phosphatase 29-like isoform X3 [Silurus meridionalis]|uniref:dual specificity phosphatase 29-like isoform X3 n=1 Tax=Silurus meridionalis TaxID=175797 RepID=UPI001EEB6A72|nr:dual specificity phosphatase 29-like isoform X3 [Silurus meridionalis]
MKLHPPASYWTFCSNTATLQAHLMKSGLISSSLMRRRTATDLTLLNTLKVTHVVNAAHGPTHINTGFAFYSHAHIQYHGVEAPDSRDFNLSMFFQTTADFIHTALSQDSGKVLVHCARGVSRSATLVLAYLMIHKRLTVAEAITAVRGYRNILPNVGFLEQLRELDARLQRKEI